MPHQFSNFFLNMVDELVVYSENDPELTEVLKFLDKTDKYGLDLTFYEKVYRCLEQADILEKAQTWRKTKEADG